MNEAPAPCPACHGSGRLMGGDCPCCGGCGSVMRPAPEAKPEPNQTVVCERCESLKLGRILAISFWEEENTALKDHIRELEGKVVETPVRWTKIISENKTLRTERDHYMKEMYRVIEELRKLRAAI